MCVNMDLTKLRSSGDGRCSGDLQCLQFCLKAANCRALREGILPATQGGHLEFVAKLIIRGAAEVDGRNIFELHRLHYIALHVQTIQHLQVVDNVRVLTPRPAVRHNRALSQHWLRRSPWPEWTTIVHRSTLPSANSSMCGGTDQ